MTNPKLIVPFQIGRPADLALAGVFLFFVIRFLTWHGFLQLLNRFLVFRSACFVAAVLHLDRSTGRFGVTRAAELLFIFGSSGFFVGNLALSTLISNLRDRRKLLSDSDIPRAKAPRTPSSENLFCFFATFASLREIFVVLVARAPR